MDSMLQLLGAIGGVGALFVGLGFLADYWREDHMGYRKIAPQGMIRFRLTTLMGGSIIVTGVVVGAAFAAMGEGFPKPALEFALKFVLALFAIRFLVVEILFLKDLLSWRVSNNGGWWFVGLLIFCLLFFSVVCTWGGECWDSLLEKFKELWLWIILVMAVLWGSIISWLQRRGFATLWREYLLEEEGSKERRRRMITFVMEGWVLSAALVSLLGYINNTTSDHALKVGVMIVLGGVGMHSLLEMLVLDEFPRKVRLRYSSGASEDYWLIDADQKFYYGVVIPPQSQDSIKVETRAKDKVKRIIFLEN